MCCQLKCRRDSNASLAILANVAKKCGSLLLCTSAARLIISKFSELSVRSSLATAHVVVTNNVALQLNIEGNALETGLNQCQQ
jgi:hypothetical protein